MAIKNNLHIVRLFDLLAIDGGEQFFESIANSFMSKNSDVEHFFREKAVQATKLNTAAIYLVGQNSSFSKTHNFEENSFLSSCAL